MSPTFPRTAKQLLVGAMERFADRTALIHDGRSLRYRDLAEQANRLAHTLIDLGVKPGEPVAILLPNGPGYVIADQAVLRIGAAKVALTDMLSDREIAYCLADCGARVAIAEGRMLAAAAGCGSPRLQTIIALDETGGPPSPVRIVPFDEAVRNQPSHLPESSAAEDDLALIIYTGGTTGKPKGVVHRQAGIAENLLSHLIETTMGDDERVLLMSPLPHSAGFLLQTAFLRGAVVYLERRFDPELVLDRISVDRITFTFMVPTMIYRVLDAADRRPLDLGSLRTILYGAAPITRDRLEQGLRVFGPVFMQLYGQSEAPNFITRLTREDHSLDPALAHRLSSCGRAAMMARVRIVDPDDPAGPELDSGQIGEIVAATPYTMSGYHELPEQTAKTLREGWLHTGDLGRLDQDGYLYLLDRKNDMIITGGLNVYSSEVESVIATLEGVDRVAVVGLPDPDWGEAVVAFVVPTGAVEGENPQAVVDRVLRSCRTELARYKVPKQVHIVSALPQTVFGKVDKKELRIAGRRSAETPPPPP